MLPVRRPRSAGAATACEGSTRFGKVTGRYSSDSPPGRRPRWAPRTSRSRCGSCRAGPATHLPERLRLRPVRRRRRRRGSRATARALLDLVDSDVRALPDGRLGAAGGRGAASGWSRAPGPARAVPRSDRGEPGRPDRHAVRDLRRSARLLPAVRRAGRPHRAAPRRCRDRRATSPTPTRCAPHCRCSSTARTSARTPAPDGCTCPAADLRAAGAATPTICAGRRTTPAAARARSASTSIAPKHCCATAAGWCGGCPAGRGSPSAATSPVG